MKIIAASLITATAAFAPHPSILVQKTTALNDVNAFGGWTPGAAASTPANVNPFGGWAPGTATSAPATPVVEETTSFSCSVPPVAAAPAFSGFGHATEPLGPNNSPFQAAEGTQRTAAAAAPPAASGPLFSGFGHATNPLGPNNSPFNTASVATPGAEAVTPTVDAPIFSGFGHAVMPMGGNTVATAPTNNKSYLDAL